MNNNVKRLRLGAAARRIGAAITALFACIPLIHASIGLITIKPAPAQGDAAKIVSANHTGVDSSGYGAPVHLVNLENQSIKESSGIAASRRNAGIFWTHNDSITKVMGAPARVYKLRAPAPKSGVSTLSYVGELRFPNQFLGFITGGDISPDGRRVVISDYLGACELILPGKRGIAFDEIWKQSPLPVDIGGFPGVRRQGE